MAVLRLDAGLVFLHLLFPVTALFTVPSLL